MIYRQISNFYRAYQGKKCVIGYTHQNRNIYAFHVGCDYGKQFLAVYAVHAREFITAQLALKHSKAGVIGGGWIIPLLNPDGVVICETRNPLWKANGRGVDINCNFDADWGSGRLNTRTRGSENCIGDYPFSECESSALARFTKRVKPAVTLAFHTKGGEIYWEYGGNGDELGAEVLAEYTGYAPKKIVGSAGGYKDWCIQKLGVPAYTIECGSDDLKHPIERLGQIKECFGLLKYFTENYEIR
ncbi:MAG: hypothetical protein K2J54_03730 [Clostridia bacterium]|nr:hypothetical protein [Clostridia bacterium]